MSERKSVLIVDDEMFVRKSLTRILAIRYEVSSASNAMEAVDLLQRTHFDILLTDYDMPQHNGYWLLEQVRASNPGMIRILFSGRNPPKVEQALQTGLIDKFLEKPVDVADLRSALATTRREPAVALSTAGKRPVSGEIKI